MFYLIIYLITNKLFFHLLLHLKNNPWNAAGNGSCETIAKTLYFLIILQIFYSWIIV